MVFARQSAPDLFAFYQFCARPGALKRGIGSQLLDDIIAAFPHGGSFRVEAEAANAGALGF
jgi:ribosomal protein S18 acetylase RimI-like enzyme